MLTKEQFNFSANSASNVAAELMWRELKAECDYEQGNIDRETYEKVVRMHRKAERVYLDRIQRPYMLKVFKRNASFAVNTGRN